MQRDDGTEPERDRQQVAPHRPRPPARAQREQQRAPGGDGEVPRPERGGDGDADQRRRAQAPRPERADQQEGQHPEAERRSQREGTAEQHRPRIPPLAGPKAPDLLQVGVPEPGHRQRRVLQEAAAEGEVQRRERGQGDRGRRDRAEDAAAVTPDREPQDQREQVGAREDRRDRGRRERAFTPVTERDQRRRARRGQRGLLAVERLSQQERVADPAQGEHRAGGAVSRHPPPDRRGHEVQQPSQQRRCRERSGPGAADEQGQRQSPEPLDARRADAVAHGAALPQGELGRPDILVEGVVPQPVGETRGPGPPRQQAGHGRGERGAHGDEPQRWGRADHRLRSNIARPPPTQNARRAAAQAARRA